MGDNKGLDWNVTAAPTTWIWPCTGESHITRHDFGLYSRYSSSICHDLTNRRASKQHQHRATEFHHIRFFYHTPLSRFDECFQCTYEMVLVRRKPPFGELVARPNLYPC